jgi:small subunit ribosomal protein S3
MAGERKIVAENLRRVLLREFLMSETKRAGFGGLDIQRTPMGTRITLIAERPGLVIGRKGSSIKSLTDAVARDFSFDNPQIEVQEVENPSLNAQIMAEKLANALERGWHFRRAGHSTLRRIMESGAKGCLIVIAGKLTGARHRRVKFKSGHIKYCGEPRNQWMRRGFAVAKLKPGVLGVTVEVMDPVARLPDEITIHPPAPAGGVPAELPPPPPVAAPSEAAAIEEPGIPEAAVKGKTAVRKLKKATQKLREIGADAVVPVDVVEPDKPEEPPEDES